MDETFATDMGFRNTITFEEMRPVYSTIMSENPRMVNDEAIVCARRRLIKLCRSYKFPKALSQEDRDLIVTSLDAVWTSAYDTHKNCNAAFSKLMHRVGQCRSADSRVDVVLAVLRHVGTNALPIAVDTISGIKELLQEVDEVGKDDLDFAKRVYETCFQICRANEKLLVAGGLHLFDGSDKK